MTLQPVVLAGGSGTRLWPLSREFFPKQFLNVAGERSLLQETLTRLEGFEDSSDPILVCNEEHRFLVAEHVRQIGKAPRSIILEPVGRNTAPALTLAALFLASESGDDPVMLVTPADHVIRDVARFQFLVGVGAALADSGALITFGVLPDSPETGFGYIRKGEPLDPQAAAPPLADWRADKSSAPHRIAAFIEKPDRDAAEDMLASEEYLWNSGIFMMRASAWLEQVGRCRPDIAEACGAAHDQGKPDGDFYRPAPDAFMTCPSDSIDYAVMEKVVGGYLSGGDGPPGPNAGGPAAECVVIPMDAGWSDVGSWSVVWKQEEPDQDGNVCRGDVHLRSTRNSLLLGQHRLVAAVGLDNVIVVETPDAVLVAHSDQVQEVRALVSELKEMRRPEQENHRKVHRPWGSYETMDEGPRFRVKRLTVNPGAALSLQKHRHRAEHWVVVGGTAKVTRDGEEFLLNEDESVYIPLGAKHRLENPGKVPLEIIEVQSGSYLSEDDIERFEDRYNRE